MPDQSSKVWNIAVLTTSRADFSIYQSTLRALDADPRFNPMLLVTGMHMSHDFGYTFKQVQDSGWPIAASYDCLLDDDSAAGIGQSMGQATAQTAKALDGMDIDMLVVLGDRYEMAAAALAAVPRGLPITHLHGGEETEGAMDNVLRHMLTKLSHLHCCVTQLAGQRIRQMGEDPDRVIVCGAPALDNIAAIPRLDREALYTQFKIPCDKAFALITYHPVTLDLKSTEIEIEALFAFIRKSGLHCVFTAANADTAGRALNAKIEDFVANTPGQMLIGHMGAKGYYSAMEHAEIIIGNSSSGILEAGSFGVPVINIGDRQKGRETSPNVINVDGNIDHMMTALDQARSDEFQAICAKRENIYGDGRAAERIVVAMARYMSDEPDARKSFALI